MRDLHPECHQRLLRIVAAIGDSDYGQHPRQRRQQLADLDYVRQALTRIADRLETGDFAHQVLSDIERITGSKREPR